MGEEYRITIFEIDGQRMLAVNNEGFDWGIDEESLYVFNYNSSEGY